MLKDVEVVRDEDGYWMHPDLEFLLNQNPEWEFIPGDIWSEWKKKHGIDVDLVELEHEPDDLPAHKRYFEKGDIDISDWAPEAPGPEYRLLSLVCTEDGPVAWWYRPCTKEEDPVEPHPQSHAAR